LFDPKDCDEKSISKRSPHAQAVFECQELMIRHGLQNHHAVLIRINQTNAIAASRNAKIEHTTNVLACDDPYHQ
jgi:hypothetical protein